jgi:DNA polymerase elongation subunit (family B)
LLDIILKAGTAQDIRNKQLAIALEHSKETLNQVMSGDIPISKLGISKVLRMPVERYRSLFPHVMAAVQLQQRQRPTKPGDLVDYAYVDVEAVNPMNRVAPLDYAETYDRDKYAEMVLDVAESILSVFGFSKTQLGYQQTSRDFLEALRGEREMEIRLELESLGAAVSS